MGKFDDYINEIRRLSGLPPLVEMKLDEGVKFYAVKNSGPTEKYPLGVWVDALPPEITRYENIPHDVDWERERRDPDYRKSFRNPQYRDELNLYLTTSSMENAMDILGLERGEHGWLMPIEKFLMRARTHVAGGAESPEEETWEQEPWEDWEDPQMKRGWTARPGSNVVQMQPKTEPRRGARVVHVGKPKGYYENIIKQMIEIAEEGKKHGATHIDIAGG